MYIDTFTVVVYDDVAVVVCWNKSILGFNRDAFFKLTFCIF